MPSIVIPNATAATTLRPVIGSDFDGSAAEACVPVDPAEAVPWVPVEPVVVDEPVVPLPLVPVDEVSEEADPDGVLDELELELELELVVWWWEAVGTLWQPSGSTYWLLLADEPGQAARAEPGPSNISPASTATSARMGRPEGTLATVCQAMKLLAFSDLHRDRSRAGRLVELAREADVVVGAGDFASMHIGLGRTIDTLSAITAPTLLVPGNNETDQKLLRACSEWPSATVLHGEGAEIDGVRFFGLGGGVPKTPFPWSFDLGEEEAAEMLEPCPERAVLIVHSPPKGHVDCAFGKHLGSEAILETIERRQPPLALCGHIHQAWGQEARIGPTRVVNVGPDGMFFEV